MIRKLAIVFEPRRGRLATHQVVALLLAVLGASAPRSALAQANYRSAPTGGRSALTGDTGVAMGSDGAAPFLNPATIVYIRDTALVFSVDFYRLSALRIGKWHQAGAIDTERFGDVVIRDPSVTKSRFDVIPSTLCVFLTVHGFGDVAEEPDEQTGVTPPPRGRQKIAACAGMVERFEVNMPTLNFVGNTGAGVTQQAQSFTLDWSRFYLGPSYSLRLGRAWSVGASLHGVYTSEAFVNSGSSVVTNAPGGAVASNVGASGKGYSFDVATLVGATYRQGRITVGLSLALPSVHAFGGYDANAHSLDVNAGGQSALLTSGTGTFAAGPPARVAVGVGADFRRWKIEVDGLYYFPGTAIRSRVDAHSVTVAGGGATAASSTVTYEVPAAGVFNASLGGEYFTSRSFSLLAGVSSDLTAAPQLAPTTNLGNFTQVRMNRMSVSFGAGSYGEEGSLLAGLQASYGWGEILAINPYVLPNAYAVVSAQAYGVMVVVSGSLSGRALTRAVQNVEDAVTPAGRQGP